MIKRAIVFISFLLISLGAFAADFSWDWAGNTTAFYTSPEAACGAQARSPWSFDGLGPGNACLYSRVDDAGNTYHNQNGSAYQLPPCSPSTWVHDPTGVCVPPPSTPLSSCNTPAGTKMTWNQFEGSGPLGSKVPTTPSMPFPTGDGKCKAVGTPNVDSCYATDTAGGRQFYCSYSATSAGSETTASDPVLNPGAPPGPNSSPASMPPKDAPDGVHCPGGTSQGGVDSSGIPICIGSGSNPLPSSSTTSTTAAPPTTTTNSDGSTTTTSSATKQNSDGSTTTTTTSVTKNADGSTSTKTTTGTSNNPTGGAGQSDGKPNKDDLCTNHPELTICKVSTIGGKCQSVVCTGDAISCAIAQQVTAQNCREQADADKASADPNYALAQQILAGNDPMKSSLPDPSSAQTVDIGTLDSSGFLGGGSCFADKTFQVQGSTITLPFSKACDYLVAFRYVVMIIASLASFRILGGAVLRD